METPIGSGTTLRYIQYRIAEKFSAGEEVFSLLSSADLETCLYILEQIEPSKTPLHLHH